LIPSDLGVTVERERFVATGRDRGPFDHLLRTAADAFGADAIGVVLAGTGADGSIGMKRLKEAGGLTVAQQVVGDGSALPASSIETGFVDFVLPLHEIAAHIQTPVDVKWPPAESQAATDTLRDILALVRVRSGHDFSAYKRATLYRRIARRMQVCECATLEAYHRYLREHPHELPHLLRDFLISVTNFFRDAEAFTALEQDIVPRLFANKGSNDQVRVWVTGCATGEEAYSIGMLLLEYASTLRAPPALQIFATDIDEAALAEARRGCYSDAIVADLTPERLVRFFTRESGQYRVTKELRELLLFSPHNVLRDPPFSRLDMVSCRNLLIYLDRDAQTRVLSLFQFGLRAQGVLFLGSSESAENTSTFAPLDVKNRLFLRQGTMVAANTPTLQAQRWNLPVLPNMPVVRERTTPIGEIHHRLVEYYAPPSMLLNSDLDVVHLSEHAGRYLQMAGGEPTRQALRLIHPELRLELRAAIYAARQSNAERRIVHFSDAAGSRHVEIRVRSVDMPDLGHGGVLVTFDDVPATMEEAKVIDDAGTIEPVMRQLEEELLRTRDQLRTTVEQYETSLEELKASNEELQAINEELRSATEELETSKEELQSVNEELTTLNQELKIKVDEISQANSDLQNLMMSTEIGVIFLDRNLNIKRFTPRVQDVFNIIPSDIGRPLTHLTHRLASDELTETAQSVLQSLRTVEKEVPTRNGSSYLVRWLPYRSIDDRIDGVVVTLIDVSDLR
ncbi:MAG TPA: CheR family methyltransferase, partial [Kofleriaceae bacterium]